MAIIINLKIEKKHLYAFIALSVLLLSVIFVRGYGSATPQVLGHTPGEIAGLTTGCPAGQSIRNISSSGVVTCETDDVNDGDTSATNEIQTLGTSGSSITLTSGGSVVAPDLSCTNCIGGTEIDESTLAGNAPSLFAGVCQDSSGSANADICIDTSGRAVCTKDSCSDGVCNSCGSKVAADLIITCNNGEIERINMVSSSAC